MTTPDPAVAARMECALSIAREAGELTLSYFQRPDLEVVYKSDASPVTAADKKAEELLRRRIGEAFPLDAILGEEGGETPGTSGFTWILDPIDGTRAFTHGIPSFATLVGVVHGGRCVAGAACAAAVGETAWAGAGLGAWWQPLRGAVVPARVSTTPRLATALIDTLWPQTFAKYGRTALHDRLAGAVKRMRTWNDAYSFMLAATGRIDAAVDWGVKVWDIAPFQVILEEAGGRFTDWAGKSDLHANHVVASNAAVHGELLGLLKQVAVGSSKGV